MLTCMHANIQATCSLLTGRACAHTSRSHTCSLLQICLIVLRKFCKVVCACEAHPDTLCAQPRGMWPCILDLGVFCIANSTACLWRVLCQLYNCCNEQRSLMPTAAVAPTEAGGKPQTCHNSLPCTPVARLAMRLLLVMCILQADSDNQPKLVC